MQQGNENKMDAVGSGEATPDMQLDEMFGRLDNAIKQQGPMARLRSLQTPLRNAIGLLTALLVLVGTYLMAARTDLSLLMSRGLFLGTILFSAGAMLLAIIVALRPYHRPAVRFAKTGVLLAVGLLAVTVLALVPAGSSTHVASRGLGGGMTCMAMGSAVGGLLFVALVLLNRGQAFGLLLSGAAAALLGNLVLQLHCADDGIGHRLFGHAGIYVLSVAVLAIVWVRKASQHTPPLA